MSEQKMPALPEMPRHDSSIKSKHGWLDAWSRPLVERIRAEAIEFGRQQERERLEPLRVAVEAVDKANKAVAVHVMLFSDARVAKLEARNATDRAMETARNLLKQTE